MIFNHTVFKSMQPPSIIEFRKYGGSSFIPLANANEIAKDVKKAINNGLKQVIFCSAPGDFTESLKSMAHEINPSLRNIAVDGLVTCSDSIGAFLLQHSLEAHNIRSLVLTGTSNGIFTNSTAGGAQVLKVEASEITQKFENFDVLIIPGGQGSDDKSITWMGKNSSDLSCILQAIATKQGCCSIYSDVDSVFNIDPNIYAEAIPFNNLDYDTVITAAKLGAKVLHHNAVVLAKEHSVEIVCKLNRPPFNVGTRIGNYRKGTIIVTDKKAQLITVRSNVKKEIIGFFSDNNILAFTKKELKILNEEQFLIPMAYVNYIDEIKKKFSSATITGQVVTALHVVSGSKVIESQFISKNEMSERVMQLYQTYILKEAKEYV